MAINEENINRLIDKLPPEKRSKYLGKINKSSDVSTEVNDFFKLLNRQLAHNDPTRLYTILLDEKVNPELNKIYTKIIELQSKLNDTVDLHDIEDQTTPIKDELRKSLVDIEDNFDKLTKEIDSRARNMDLVNLGAKIAKDRKKLISLQESTDSTLEGLSESLQRVLMRLGDFAKKSDLPKDVRVRGGSNVTVRKSEDNNQITYTINAKGGERSIFAGFGGKNFLTSLLDTPDTLGASGTYLQSVGDKTAWATIPGGVGEANTGSNIGVTGIGVFDSKAGVDLQFRNINPITSDLRISLGASGTIDIGTTNILTPYTTNDLTEGVSNFYYTESRFNASLATKSTNDLAEGTSNFYYRADRIVGAGGASISRTGLTVVINVTSSGEANTASNVGLSGVGVFLQKTGVDLEFRTINSINAGLLVTQGASGSIDLGLTNLLTPYDTNNLTEGSSNFYYTEARFDTSFSGKDTDGLSEGVSNFYYTEARFDASLSGKDTNSLSEGASNFYYTEARFDTSFSAKDTNALTEGSSNFYYTETRFNTSFGNKSTNDLAEGASGLYYSISRFNTDFATKNTNDLAEGVSNFYYTEARFDSSFGGKDTNALAEGSSNFYYTEARFDTSFSGKDTDGLSEGVSNFYYTEARFDSSLATKNTDNLAEGVSNFYWIPTRVSASNGILSTVTGLTNAISGIGATYTGVGVVELATSAEITGSTDISRAVTPDALSGSDYGKRVVSLLVTAPTTGVTTGDGQVYMRTNSVINGYNLVAVAGGLVTAGLSITQVQVYNATRGITMLTYPITFDIGENDTSTGASPAIISGSSITVFEGDQLRVDVPVVGATAQGLIIDLTFQHP